MKKMPVALALGGGGARGFAHIGVLKVLERESIPIDLIVGTSSGALIGGSYASGTSPKEIEASIERYVESDEFQSSAMNAIEIASERGDAGLARKIQGYILNKWWLLQAMFKSGILTAEDFQGMIDYFIPDIDIKDTVIPFRAVTVDLVTGERVVFKEGPLRRAVMASCALPGAIEPLRLGDMVLADGGVVSLVPVIPAREEGAKTVIAVAVDRDISSSVEFRTAQEIYERANDITFCHLARLEMAKADVLIDPEVGDMNWSDFSHAFSLVGEGEKAATACIPDILRIIEKQSLWSRLRRTVEGIGNTFRGLSPKGSLVNGGKVPACIYVSPKDGGKADTSRENFRG